MLDIVDNVILGQLTVYHAAAHSPKVISVEEMDQLLKPSRDAHFHDSASYAAKMYFDVLAKAEDSLPIVKFAHEVEAMRLKLAEEGQDTKVMYDIYELSTMRIEFKPMTQEERDAYYFPVTFKGNVDILTVFTPL